MALNDKKSKEEMRKKDGDSSVKNETNSKENFQSGQLYSELTDLFKSINTMFNSLQGTVETKQTNNSQNSKAISNEKKFNFNAKIEIPIPEFSDEYINNPVEYIIDLKEYLDLKNIMNEGVPLIIRRSLKGRARAWYFANFHKCNDFSEFEMDFCEEFDSMEYRAEKTNEWRNKRFSRNDKSFVQYFYEQVKESNYIDPPLSEYARNYAIVRQLPRKIQDTLACIKLGETAQIVKTLSWLDNSEREYNQRKRNGGWNREIGKEQDKNDRESRNEREDRYERSSERNERDDRNERRTDRNEREKFMDERGRRNNDDKYKWNGDRDQSRRVGKETDNDRRDDWRKGQRNGNDNFDNRRYNGYENRNRQEGTGNKQENWRNDNRERRGYDSIGRRENFNNRSSSDRHDNRNIKDNAYKSNRVAAIRENDETDREDELDTEIQDMLDLN